jgi:hypothetical protein
MINDLELAEIDEVSGASSVPGWNYWDWLIPFKWPLKASDENLVPIEN